jgi:SNF2 family DNA or RNA helicase
MSEYTSGGKPVGVITLAEDSDTLRVEFMIRYGRSSGLIHPGDGAVEISFVDDSGFPVIAKRDTIQEEKLVDDFRKRCSHLTPQSTMFGLADIYTGDEAYRFIAEVIHNDFGDYAVSGLEDLKKYNVLPGTAVLTLSVEEPGAVLSGGVIYKDELIPIAECAKRISAGKRTVVLKGKRRGLIPVSWVREYSMLFELSRIEDDVLCIHRFHLPLLEQFAMSLQDEKVADTAALCRKQFSLTVGDETLDIHDFSGTLREYQKNGCRWLDLLHTCSVGGILADDMGLGKTVQTIAQLCRLLSSDKLKGPVLVVCPTTLIFNWKSEFAKFAHTINIIDYTGANRVKDFTDDVIGEVSSSVMITTYRTLLADAALLAGINWYYVILDEAQYIKNPATATHKAVMKLTSMHRLALTGTPVENSLMDLWSMMHFLNPGFLGPKQFFTRRFLKPIEKNPDGEAAKVLHELISPLVLRRTKDIVAGELPKKEEQVLYTSMDSRQQDLYNEVKETYKKKLLAAIRKGPDRARMLFLEGMLRLRQICCHPMLYDTDSTADCPKLQLLLSKTEEALSEDHNVLIFSQFTSMLSIIKQKCNEKNIPFCYLDGKSRDREAQVKRFQSDSTYNVFLISLKAGGLGLNLTAADYVFHYDPWWNPAVTAQATDRAHRIGQQKPVFSYKYITLDSIEEKVLMMQEKKEKLAESIIKADIGGFKELNEEIIKKLFG